MAEEAHSSLSTVSLHTNKQLLRRNSTNCVRSQKDESLRRNSIGYVSVDIKQNPRHELLHRNSMDCVRPQKAESLRRNSMDCVHPQKAESLRRNSIDCVRPQQMEPLRLNSIGYAFVDIKQNPEHELLHRNSVNAVYAGDIDNIEQTSDSVNVILKTEKVALTTVKSMWDPLLLKLKEIGQYAYLIIVLYGLPVALAASLPAIRPALFWMGSSSIFVTTIWLIAEAFASYKSWNNSKLLHAQKLPNDLPLDVAAIISAYLSNEIDVIENTIKAVSSLNLPDGGKLKVVVAHNGGNAAEMGKLSEIIYVIGAKPNVEIINLHVSNSHSKAENVNAAISYLSAQTQAPKVCVMYDADHQPDKNAMVYALHSMSTKNAQLLQGRCVIKRGSPLLAAEFDMIYGVNHAGGSVLRNFAFFGGTNGYWNFDLLTKIGMDESMLTEDIDSSFRSLSSGANIIYDPLVTSYEEAPDSLNSLMKQRMRWAQGWSQVSVRHLRLLNHNKFSPYRKTMIFLVLHWREIYYYLTPLTLPAAVASFIANSKFAYPLIAISVVQTMIPTFMVLLARYHVGDDRHPNLHSFQYAKYIVIAPIYDTVKNAVCVLGHFRNTCNMTKWRVTSRAKPIAYSV